MAIRTTHTLLARVTSHGSGGRAQILIGHYALEAGRTDPYLTNIKFKSVDLWKLVIVELTLSGKRRMVKKVTLAPEGMTRTVFRTEYAGTLDKEARTYDRLHGIKKVESRIEHTVAMSLDEEPEESKEAEKWDLVEEAHQELFGDGDAFNGWLGDIYVDPPDMKVYESMKTLSGSQNGGILMIGPSGAGKTSIPEALAKEWGWDCLVWDCANTGDDPTSFFGSMAAKDGSTIDDEGKTLFVPTELSEKIQQPNTIIVLDEVNRINVELHGSLFPLLDHRGRTSVFGHEIVRAENVLIFATANIGYEYTGTFVLDTAFVNRFVVKMRLSWLPENIEKKMLCDRTGISTPQAHNIVKLFTSLRKLSQTGDVTGDLSPRVSQQVALLVSTGIEVKEAFTYTVVNALPDEQGKLVVETINLA